MGGEGGRSIRGRMRRKGVDEDTVGVGRGNGQRAFAREGNGETKTRPLLSPFPFLLKPSFASHLLRWRRHGMGMTLVGRRGKGGKFEKGEIEGEMHVRSSETLSRRIIPRECLMQEIG